MEIGGRALHTKEMLLLTEFLLRLVFGMAAAMTLVSGRQVTAGYFRNNLYVLLGLSALAALLSRVVAPSLFWPATAAAIVSYTGAVCWLYERPAFGKIALATIAVIAGVGISRGMPSLTPVEQRSPQVAGHLLPGGDVLGTHPYGDSASRSSRVLRTAANLSAGLLLGVTMAAMLLGHWYLNSPTMQLAPLRKLLVAMAGAAALQIIVCALGVSGELAIAPPPPFQWWLFIALRWLFGLVGVALLIWMAWRTLAIPNTQSATGILYVAVIGVFVGETMSLLLSAESVYPL